MGRPTKIVLSYGMGADSSAILARWLLEPSSRDFDLEDLTVITAMTGNEFASTGRLVEKHIFPLLRENRVRFVQVARKSREMKGGMDAVVVLDDSRCPTKLYVDGAYKLSDEMHAAATVPQFASGKRLCSVKFKGFPLDAWIENETGGSSFRHVMGFNAEEVKRAERDTSYSTESRSSEYPLIEWGWDRAKLESYLEETFGEPWEKSCCTFCPFAGCSGGKAEHLVRLRTSAEAAADGMFMEYVSLAFNEYMALFAGGKGLIDSLKADGNTAAIKAFEKRLDGSGWHLYSVRRVMHGVGRGDRSITKISTKVFSREDAEYKLVELSDRYGLVFETDAHGIHRAYSRKRTDKEKGKTRKDANYPTAESFLVAVPTEVADKEKAVFAKRWKAIGDLDKVTTPCRAAA
jgi:hypothetical protein